jgi:hypothetical protein
LDREAKLLDVAKRYNPKVLVTGSEVDANMVAFGIGIPIINVNDMPVRNYFEQGSDAHPVTRLTMPLSKVIMKPFMVPDEIYLSLGLKQEQIFEYPFIDPFIWLDGFTPNIEYVKEKIPNIDFNKKIVVVREEEFKASYVTNKHNFMLDLLLELDKLDINLIVIPRYEENHLEQSLRNAIVLREKMIIQHLLAFSHLFIGGGGTINIEATYFGVPAISTRSFVSHYDKFLIDKSLMFHSNDVSEILNLTDKLLQKDTKSTAKEVYSKMKLDINIFTNKILKVANGEY